MRTVYWFLASTKEFKTGFFKLLASTRGLPSWQTVLAIGTIILHFDG